MFLLDETITAAAHPRRPARDRPHRHPTKA
jgi:hypothetical protein